MNTNNWIMLQFFIITDKQTKLKNEYQFQFPFTSEFSSIVTQNTVTISKKCSIFKEKKYL